MRAKFENASLVDAITRANIVAPVRGHAFDKSAGILLDVGADGTTMISSTDTMVYFRNWSRALEVDEPFELLLPSKLFADAISALPIGSDKHVTLEVKAHGHGRRLLISSGRLKAFLNIMSADLYPRWPAFDPDSLSVVASIGGALKAVEWATAPAGEEPFSGVHLTRGRLVATDRYKSASVECDCGDIDDITIPAGEVAKLLKQSGEVRFGLADGMMLFMPDDSTQIMATTIESKYPSIDRAFHTEQTDYFTVFKTEVLELLQNVNNFQAGASRTPRLELRLDGSKLQVLSSAGDAGGIANDMDVESTGTHESRSFFFAPDKLLPCISNAFGDKLVIYYLSDEPNGTWRIVGDKTYQAWVKPLTVGEGM